MYHDHAWHCNILRDWQEMWACDGTVLGRKGSRIQSESSTGKCAVRRWQTTCFSMQLFVCGFSLFITRSPSSQMLSWIKAFIAGLFADDVWMRVFVKVGPNATHGVPVDFEVDIIDTGHVPAGPGTLKPVDLVGCDASAQNELVHVEAQTSRPAGLTRGGFVLYHTTIRLGSQFVDHAIGAARRCRAPGTLALGTRFQKATINSEQLKIQIQISNQTNLSAIVQRSIWLLTNGIYNVYVT